ncbi:MAG: hypothetical protein SGBAC_006092 [Bacillariaceae sp.]
MVQYYRWSYGVRLTKDVFAEACCNRLMANLLHSNARNVLEWYDFALFGFFSDIISQVFFPPEDDGEENPQSNRNLIISFFIFGGAFLVRPIGGLLIGYVGDKYGRKQALTQSLFLMAIPTTLMGCLPSYETAGILSPICLCVCRLLQGISVGGQLPASLVYTVESRDPSEWGFYGALPMMAANSGTLLGNIVGAVMKDNLSKEQLLNWGWRIPFSSGILIALVAQWLKNHGANVHTTVGVYDHEDAPVQNPIRLAFARGNRIALLSSSLVPILWAGGFFVTFVWMGIYMSHLLNPPIPGAFWINATSMVFGLTLMLPVAGALSDKIGRVRVMSMAALGLTIGGPILLLLISGGNGYVAFGCQLILGLHLSFFGGPLSAWMVESFSPEVRLTSASLGYDLAHSVVGGFSPAIATVLYDSCGTKCAGVLYSIFGITSLVGLYLNLFCGNSPDRQTKEPISKDVEGGDREVAQELREFT